MPEELQELTLQMDEPSMAPADAPITAEPAASPSSSGGEIGQMFRSAARLTAQTLLLEIEGLNALNPDYQPDVDQEQAQAQTELTEGDAKALADDDESAIQHYRNAWLHASSARLHALRTR